MAIGKKTGGRKKGTPNKNTQAVQAKLDAIGVDPILGMAQIAIDARDTGDYQLAGNMLKELAQYVYPKRKAVEHSVDPGDTVLSAILNEISGAQDGLPKPVDD